MSSAVIAARLAHSFRHCEALRRFWRESISVLVKSESPRGFLRFAALATLAASLGSCSYGYDIRAIAIGVRLAFVPMNNHYKCLANINVSTEQARAVPAAADDRLLVLNGGAYWWTHNPVIDCKVNFPVFYGATAPNFRTIVTAKQLKTGVLYEVNTEGDGAYGYGCFRIRKDLRIENFKYDACAEIARRSMKRLNESS